MKSPCKVNGVDCPDRTPVCHSKCEKYIAFDEENQKRREQRYKNLVANNASPSKASRIRRHKINKMRSGKK